MASTPRSLSPRKPSAVDKDHEDVSMTVEPPTQLLPNADEADEDESKDKIDPDDEPGEEETVRLRLEPPRHIAQPQPQKDFTKAGRSQSEPAEGPFGRSEVRTPDNVRRRSQKTDSQPSPGHLPPFDWDGFENRYKEALRQSDSHEQELLEEFDQLVKYFNAWAAASSSHDNERAVKRLQTRERYVHISEATLAQKKKHLNDVLRAFQGALTLLSSK